MTKRTSQMSSANQLENPLYSSVTASSRELGESVHDSPLYSSVMASSRELSESVLESPFYSSVMASSREFCESVPENPLYSSVMASSRELCESDQLSSVPESPNPSLKTFLRELCESSLLFTDDTSSWTSFTYERTHWALNSEFSLRTNKFHGGISLQTSWRNSWTSELFTDELAPYFLLNPHPRQLLAHTAFDKSNKLNINSTQYKIIVGFWRQIRQPRTRVWRTTMKWSDSSFQPWCSEPLALVLRATSFGWGRQCEEILGKGETFWNSAWVWLWLELWSELEREKHKLSGGTWSEQTNRDELSRQLRLDVDLTHVREDETWLGKIRVSCDWDR